METVALILATFIAVSLGGPVEDCPILQTTDPRTPCHIKINPSLQTEPVPSFVYMINLPGPTSEQPCPFLQTLDAHFRCYTPPATRDDPALTLQVPLPPKADELDESPSGIAKLRQAKFKTLTTQPSAEPTLPVVSPSNAPSSDFPPLPQGDPEFTVAYSPSAQTVPQMTVEVQPAAQIFHSPPSPQVSFPSFPYVQFTSFSQPAPPAPHQYYGVP